MIGNFLYIQEFCKAPIISESTQTELEARGFLEIPNGRHTFQQLQEVQSNYADSARDVAEVALRVFLLIAAIAGALAVGFGAALDLPWLIIAGLFSAFICGGMTEDLSAKPMRKVRPLPSSETVAELMKKAEEHLDATYRYIRNHGESMERLTDGTVREEIRFLRNFFANHPRVKAEIEELLFVPESQEHAVKTNAEPNAPLPPGVKLCRDYWNNQGRVMNIYEVPDEPLPPETRLCRVGKENSFFPSPWSEIFVRISRDPGTPFPSVARLYRNFGRLIRAELGEPLPSQTLPSAPAVS